MSNQQVAIALKRSLADGWKDFFRSLLSDCEFPAEAAEIPVVFDDPVYGQQGWMQSETSDDFPRSLSSPISILDNHKDGQISWP